VDALIAVRTDPGVELRSALGCLAHLRSADRPRRVPVISKEVLSPRTADYQKWVEAFAGNHNIPIEWAERGVRKEEYVHSVRRTGEEDDRAMSKAETIFCRWHRT
jgi:hypothetical protein